MKDSVLKIMAKQFKEAQHKRDALGRFTYSDSLTTGRGVTKHRFDAHTESGENVGFAVVKKEKGEVSLDDVRVLPSFQKQGLGGELVRRAVDAYKTQPISLKVSPHYDKAMSSDQLKTWYQKHGFVDVGNDRMVRRSSTS